jgi:Cu/Ag efflux protein CusF
MRTGFVSGYAFRHTVIVESWNRAFRRCYFEELTMPHKCNSSSPAITLLALSFLLALSLACNRGAPPPAGQPQGGTKRYSLKGKVISVNKQAGNASIYNDPIAGFMDPMAMPYTIKAPATLDELQPGDTVTADVVVEPDKYWLENVKVTAHSQTPAGKPAPAGEKLEK